jgi:CRISPR system Cascade subunit CasD
MLSDIGFLALLLEGPFQSWGIDSQYSRRTTGLMPSKSAVAGMCCAALGYSRGSAAEGRFLGEFSHTQMTTIAIPRRIAEKRLLVRRLQDYHTIQNTKTAEGKIKDCHITHRQYLTDASFGVLLAGPKQLLVSIAEALADPVWGIWLGRKNCIPSAPVLAGLSDVKEDALRLVIGDRPIESFTRQEEVTDFTEGRDALSDAPVSFATERRLFAPRRVKIAQGTGQI